MSDDHVGESAHKPTPLDNSFDPKDYKEPFLYQNQLDDPAVYTAYIDMLEGLIYWHINTFNGQVQVKYSFFLCTIKNCLLQSPTEYTIRETEESNNYFTSEKLYRKGIH